MENNSDSKTNPSQNVIYEIRIKGHLDSQWTDWFEGLTIKLEDNGDTILNGPVIDQAALHGLLKKVRDLGMPLISVSPIEPDLPTLSGAGQADMSDVRPLIANHVTHQDRSKKEKK